MTSGTAALFQKVRVIPLCQHFAHGTAMTAMDNRGPGRLAEFQRMESAA